MGRRKGEGNLKKQGWEGKKREEKGEREKERKRLSTSYYIPYSNGDSVALVPFTFPKETYCYTLQ